MTRLEEIEARLSQTWEQFRSPPRTLQDDIGVSDIMRQTVFALDCYRARVAVLEEAIWDFVDNRIPYSERYEKAKAAVDALTPEDLAECGVEVGE